MTIAWTWLQSPNLLCSCHSGQCGTALLSVRALSCLALLSCSGLGSSSFTKQFYLAAPWHEVSPNLYHNSLHSCYSIRERYLSHNVTWSLENTIIKHTFALFGAWIIISHLCRTSFGVWDVYLTRNYSILFHSSGHSITFFYCTPLECVSKDRVIFLVFFSIPFMTPSASQTLLFNSLWWGRVLLSLFWRKGSINIKFCCLLTFASIYKYLGPDFQELLSLWIEYYLSPFAVTLSVAMVEGQNFFRPELGSCTKHEKYTGSLVQVWVI